MGKLEEAGYAGQTTTIKSDQEESVVALKRAVAVRRGGNITDKIAGEAVQSQRGNGKGDKNMAGTIENNTASP